MNIELGPLMNIQVHSYQSKEIADKIDGAYNIGEVEHFNIYIFRNVDIIGGKPMEKYSLNDFYDDNQIMLGFNETARKIAFDDFLSSRGNQNNIYDHKLGITILSKVYEAITKTHNMQPAIESFTI